jgi:hypothetical protein
MKEGINNHVVGTLVSVNIPPKGLHWKVEVDGRTIEDESELLDSVRATAKKPAYFMRTNFRAKNSRSHERVRKKHFTDGYYMYTFWFERKADAALFKLFNG